MSLEERFSVEEFAVHILVTEILSSGSNFSVVLLSQKSLPV